MPAAFEKCIGTKQQNGPLCCAAVVATQPSTLRGKILLMTSASAISGIFHRAFRIRSRVLIRMAASSSWSSATVLQRRQYLPVERLVQAHSEGSAVQKFRYRGLLLRSSPESKRALYFLFRCAGVPCLRQDRRGKPGVAELQPQDDGAKADQDQERHGADHR